MQRVMAYHEQAITGDYDVVAEAEAILRDAVEADALVTA